MVIINFISTWAQGIIVSVIIATIIEMILPESNNSKYIKTVIGIFILFTIISPIIAKIKGGNTDTNLEDYIEVSSGNLYEVDNKIDNKELIKNMYIENLKIDIKSKVTQKGYIVGDVYIDVLNDDEFTLNSINIKIDGTTDKKDNSNNTSTIVENVEQILINVGAKDNKKKDEERSVISLSERRKIVQYLSSVYEVKENNIIVR